MGRFAAATTFVREIWFRFTNRVYGPGTKTRPWTWIGDERIAIGSIPTPASLLVLQRETRTEQYAALQGWTAQIDSLCRAVSHKIA